jgi:hypothetical protein
MNISPTIRSPNFNLWTLGHRRYYSPLLRAPGGRLAARRMTASLDRPNLAGRAPAAGIAANTAPGASPHVHGVQ